MNLPTQNHLHPIIFITLLIFLNLLFNPFCQITLTQSLPHPLMLPKLPQPIPSYHSDQSSPDTPRISPELDNFITLQQQPYHLNTPTINQISSITISSNPPTPSSNYTESLTPSSTSTISSLNTNRAYRTFKRKFPNHPFPAKPGTAREYINHPQHTNTKEFLAITLPVISTIHLKHPS